MNTPDCDASQRALRDLRSAAEAWETLKIAESHIGRLNRYESLSPAMKADRMRHITNASAARTTLDRILKVRA